MRSFCSHSAFLMDTGKDRCTFPGAVCTGHLSLSPATCGTNSVTHEQSEESPVSLSIRDSTSPSHPQTARHRRPAAPRPCRWGVDAHTCAQLALNSWIPSAASEGVCLQSPSDADSHFCVHLFALLLSTKRSQYLCSRQTPTAAGSREAVTVGIRSPGAKGLFSRGPGRRSHSLTCQDGGTQRLLRDSPGQSVRATAFSTQAPRPETVGIGGPPEAGATQPAEPTGVTV